MKHILYGILATLLMTNVTFGQSIPSTDEAHRIMMNDYAVKLNNILTAHANGVELNLFKKQIASGTAILSATVRDSITTFAVPLKAYGTHFADINELTATTDAMRYFYSSFAPSTVVQDGKLVESTTAAGLTATEMWTCALENFNTDNCGLSALVSDKSNLNTLATACVNKLTTVPTLGDMGMLVMLDNYDYCTNTRIKPELFDFVGEAHNQALDYTYKTVVSQNPNCTFNDMKISNNYFLTHLYKYRDGTAIDDSGTTEQYVNNIITEVTTQPLSYNIPAFSAEAKDYIDTFQSIIENNISDNNPGTNLINTIQKINELNRNISRSGLDESEKYFLYMGNSVGKSSLQYWSANQNNWNSTTSTARCGICIKVWADIKGFLVKLAKEIIANPAITQQMTDDVHGLGDAQGTEIIEAAIKVATDVKGPVLNGASASSQAGKTQ